MNRLMYWQGFIDKFEAKLSKWKANLLSIGGRSTLLKAVLGSVGIYYMSLFKVPESIFDKLERLRARFFWGVGKDTKKLIWVKWENVLASFDKGGLDIGSLKAFNVALLQKWRWRLNSNSSLLWVEVIKAIYGEDAGIDQLVCKSHGLWSNIIDTINHLHSSGIIPKGTLRYKVGCGSKVRFWIDTWIGDTPLSKRYNRLYRLEVDPNYLIRDRLVDGEWIMNWQRPIESGRTHVLWEALKTELQAFSHFEGQDEVCWNIAVDGKFTVGITRKHIDDIILPTLDVPTSWCKILPRKVNIFLWRLKLNRFPHRLNLSRRGLDISSILCPVCSNGMESNDHVFYSCEIALNIWRLIRIWSDFPMPAFTSHSDWISWFDGVRFTYEHKVRLQVIVATTWWFLWKYRNLITFHSQRMRKCDLFDNIRLYSFY